MPNNVEIRIRTNIMTDQATKDFNSMLKNLQSVADASSINVKFKVDSVSNEKILKDAEKLVNIQNRAIGAAGNFEAYLKNLQPKALKKYGAEIESIRNNFKKVQSEMDSSKEAGRYFTRARSEVTALKGTMKELGLESRTFFGEMMNNLKKFATWYFLGNILVGVLSKIKQIYQNVKLIDQAMTDLKKVTDETDWSYSNFLSNTAKKAQEIGTTIRDLIASTASWARIGFSIQEASKLAQSTAVYANVGDLSVDQATTSMISTLKAFNIEASKSISIVDKFNEVNFLPLCA